MRRQVQHFLLSSLSAGRDGDVAPAGGDAVERAVLVIDELTSNALRHGSTPSILHIGDDEGRWIVIVTALQRGARVGPETLLQSP